MRIRQVVVMAVVALMGLTLAPAATGASSTAQRSTPGYNTKVIVRGAAIHGANGLAVKAGKLLVASAMGSEIVKVDRRTGAVLQRIGQGPAVDSPDDVAVGPDGSIYWTDLPAGEVGRLAPDGTVTKQFVGVGVNPIAFSPDGRLFVAQAFYGDGLYEVDPALVKPPRVVIPDSGPAGAPWPAQLNGFDFSRSGRLYAPQPFLGRVVRIDPDTGALAVVAKDLPQPPSSVEFDHHGRLFASLVYGTIVRIDRATGGTTILARIRHADLDNMVFDGRGRLYVSDSNTGAVYTVTRDGRVRTLVRGGLILPGGLALLRGTTGHRSLFVSDVWNLPEYSPRTGRLLSMDTNSRIAPSITTSWNAAPDGRNVIVSSWMNNEVQIWNPRTDKAVRSYTDFAVPLNAIRYRDSLVVAELGKGDVVRQTPAGTRTVLAAGLKVPAGLAATRGALWVSDYATGKVWQVVAHGDVLGTPRLVAAGLHAPEGMAVAHDGSLLVVQSTIGRLSRINRATGRVTTVAAHLRTGLLGSRAAPPTWAMSSVAVGHHGRIYVSGDRGDVLYRLTPRR
ncbi:MAG TPA: hypothetical protein VFM09_11490 [Marmoricola sp.]|nr:hypothetical protein [Marmoricola sp.]